MVKLNGSQGGSFPHEIDFGVIEIQQEDGSILQQKEKIKTIIEQALLQYGQEDLSNIFLNDLPENGLELLEYKGKTPMYLIIQTDGSNITQFINYTLDQNIKVWINDNGNIKEILISEIPQYWSLGVLNTSYNEQATTVGMKKSDILSLPQEVEARLNIVKLEFGNTIGYQTTDLVYAGDLILKAGENVVSLLDKIKTMLGSFEYFYDIDGRFVLQKKKDYLQELFSPVNGEIIEPLAIVSPYIYEFKDDTLFTSKSIQPKIDNIKNDFVIWTKKSTANGGQIDIHTRYAIDKKPLKYVSPWGHYESLLNSVLAYKCKKIDNNYFLDCRDGQVYLSNKLNTIYTQNGSDLTVRKYTALDQGTIFYQLTTEKISFSLNDDTVLLYLEVKSEEYQLITPNEMIILYYHNNDGSYTQIRELPKKEEFKITIDDYTRICLYVGGGKTYYSYDYNDINSIIENDDRYDWRELIYQMAFDYLNNNNKTDFYLKLAENNPEFIDGKTGYEQYYTDLLGFWRLLYNPYDNIECFDKDSSKEQRYWNKYAYTNPDTLLFWFDFLDLGEAPIGQYSVRKIGMRQKIDNKNSNNNTNIFLPSTPEILYTTDDDNEKQEGYTTLQIPKNMEQLISISSQGLTVIEQMNNLIYDHSYCSENVNFSAIPMFWLQPNTRIYVEGIGDLILTKISYQLTHNGTMNLTCTKVVEPLY